MRLPLVLLLAGILLVAVEGKKKLKLKVQLVTWNVNKKQPPGDLSALLDLRKSPDLLAVGLQEVASPSGPGASEPVIAAWTAALDAAISPRGYRKVRAVSMVGITLSVYSLERHISHVSSLEENQVMAGTREHNGNKGGVSLSFRLYGSRLGFVSAHLTHSEEGLNQRIQDFHLVEAQRNTSNAQEDYTFWMGDLNFRLSDPAGLPADRIHELVQRGQLKKLRHQDELHQLMKEAKVFQGYSEMDITFKPTYKHVVGSSSYDLKRRPAWTDRVLFRAADGGKVTPKNYRSIEGISLSDHRPVEAVLQIRVAKE